MEAGHTVSSAAISDSAKQALVLNIPTTIYPKKKCETPAGTSGPASYYAVQKGRKIGVYSTWDECEGQIKGFSGNKYKKFPTREEAEVFAFGTPSQSPPKEVSFPTTPLDSRSTRPIASLPVTSPDAELASSVLSGWDVVYLSGVCEVGENSTNLAGVGIWWGPGDPRNVTEKCRGEQTAEQAELMAILRVLESTKITTKPFLIWSHSEYSINRLKTWTKSLQANNCDQPHAGIIRHISKYLEVRSNANLPTICKNDWDSITDVIEIQLNQTIIRLGRKTEETEILGPNEFSDNSLIECRLKLPRRCRVGANSGSWYVSRRV